MPFVNISIPKGKPREYVKAIANGVNSAVIDTMGFPDVDRNQIIHEVEPYCLEYQDRQEDRVMMFLIMRKGRRNDEKKSILQKGG